MSQPVLVYRHAQNPRRGLAATGIVFIKFVLAIPALAIVSALSSLASVAAYLGYWVVGLKGTFPGALFHFIDLSFRFSARAYGWIIGITDVYPPFELDPEYPIDVRSEKPTAPSTGWAWAGVFLLKFVVLIPHFIALAFVAVAMVLSVWFGYFVVLFTGSLPVGIQDFAAGTLQWGYRVTGFLYGLSDEYPKFSLQVTPTR